MEHERLCVRKLSLHSSRFIISIARSSRFVAPTTILNIRLSSSCARMNHAWQPPVLNQGNVATKEYQTPKQGSSDGTDDVMYLGTCPVMTNLETPVSQLCNDAACILARQDFRSVGRQSKRKKLRLVGRQTNKKDPRKQNSGCNHNSSSVQTPRVKLGSVRGSQNEVYGFFDENDTVRYHKKHGSLAKTMRDIKHEEIVFLPRFKELKEEDVKCVVETTLRSCYIQLHSGEI
ncbi:hypothetical protein LZ32DRAFT_218747 [Colletotrichum eremochloae]|nr:hypothetical protein LZ32DRAFT_218747 [Colletotrichum eremochloae]